LKQKLKTKVLVPLILCLVLTGIIGSLSYGQKAIKRWVTGVVVATDTKAIPNTIVVRSKTWRGEELIVGAQVHKDTRITINGEIATLADIVPGDKVSMIYMREPTRLVARIIKITR